MRGLQFVFNAKILSKISYALPAWWGLMLHSSHGIHLCDHSDLLHLCPYVFPCAKPSRQPLDHFPLSQQNFEIHCQVIFRPFQLFLLLEEVSNIIFSCMLILTVGHLVASRHLNVSRFMIQHQLLPSHH